MQREIHIDLQTERAADPYTLSGDHHFLREIPTKIKFIFTLFLDGRKAVVKEFESSFRDRDTENEGQLAHAIMQNAMKAGVVGIYDVENPHAEPGDELIIEFSPAAKEMFEFLRKYSPKLLDVFSPSFSPNRS